MSSFYALNALDLNILEDNIISLIKKIALPASIGFVFMTLYSVVDTYFAGTHISSNALAGITYTFPIQLIIMAFGMGITSGLTALTTKAMGEQQAGKAIKYLFNALMLVVGLSIMLGLLAWFGAKPIISSMGGSGEALQAGIEYLQITALGLPLMMFTYLLNTILSIQGDTKSFRNSVIFAFFLNCILNPVFILYFDWGVYGLAWATFIVQIQSVIYLSYKSKNSKLAKLIQNKFLEFDKKYISNILSQGLPSSLNTIAVSIQLFIMNYYVDKYAGPSAVAGMGAAFRVEQLFIVPTIALSIAAMTIMGHNYGAGNISRIRETFNKSISIGASLIGTGCIIIFAFGNEIVILFDKTPEVVEFGIRYLNVSMVVMTSYAFISICTATLQSFQKPLLPLIITFFRRVVLTLIFFEVSTTYFNMGIDGFIYSIMILPWIGATMYMITTLTILRRKEREFNNSLMVAHGEANSISSVS